MKRIFFFLIVFLIICSISIQPVYAQTRGDGVGALLGKSQGDQEVTISDGRTAPGAQIFVEDGEGDVQVEAKLDDRGVFNFSFKTDIESYNEIYIYAQDVIGISPKVAIEAGEINGVLLPPSITVDGAPTAGQSATIYGYTFPGATVTLRLQPEGLGLSREFSAIANSTGLWEVQVDRIAQGSYTARAHAQLGDTRSVDSYLLSIVTEVSLITRTLNVASKALLVPAGALVLVPLGFSILDIYYYLLRLLMGVRGLVYFPNRKKTKWGVVYDALTKSFLSGAIVRLYKDTGELVETEVTGLTGSFSFLPVPGKYSLRVIKPEYTFPTTVISGAIDGEYSPIYHGEVFEVADFRNPLTLSVPMDRKDAQGIGVVKTVMQVVRQYRLIIELVLVAIGLLASSLVWLQTPTFLNSFVVFIYILILIYIFYDMWRKKEYWGMVRDESGQPAAYVSLSLVDTEFHRQVQRRVSDGDGRYQFIAPSGSYQIVVSSDSWMHVQKRGAYDGGSIVVKGDADLVRPTIIVRRKQELPSSQVAQGS